MLQRVQKQIPMFETRLAVVFLIMPWLVEQSDEARYRARYAGRKLRSVV